MGNFNKVLYINCTKRIIISIKDIRINLNIMSKWDLINDDIHIYTFHNIKVIQRHRIGKYNENYGMYALSYLYLMHLKNLYPNINIRQQYHDFHNYEVIFG